MLAFAVLFLAVDAFSGEPGPGIIVALVCVAFACFTLPDPPRRVRLAAASRPGVHPAVAAHCVAVHAADCARIYSQGAIRAAQEGRFLVARAGAQATAHAAARAEAAALLATQSATPGWRLFGSAAQLAAARARGHVHWAHAFIRVNERLRG